MVKEAGRRLRKYRRKLERPNPVQVPHTALKVVKGLKYKEFRKESPCLELLDVLGVTTYLKHNLGVVDKAYILRLLRELYGGKDIYGKCLKWLGSEEICNELVGRASELIQVCHYLDCESIKGGDTNIYVTDRGIRLRGRMLLKETCLIAEKVKNYLRSFSRSVSLRPPFTKVRTIPTTTSLTYGYTYSRTFSRTVEIGVPQPPPDIFYKDWSDGSLDPFIVEYSDVNNTGLIVDSEHDPPDYGGACPVTRIGDYGLNYGCYVGWLSGNVWGYRYGKLKATLNIPEGTYKVKAQVLLWGSDGYDGWDIGRFRIRLFNQDVIVRDMVRCTLIAEELESDSLSWSGGNTDFELIFEIVSVGGGWLDIRGAIVGVLRIVQV